MSALPRLLVLDDDPVMREIIAVLAERQGFETRMADSPAEFFSVLVDWAPTHISIDLVMPTQDGIEILRELAVRGCTANIVIVSSMELKVLESARRVAVERGLNVSGVLAKPFKHDALREVLGIAMPLPPRASRVGPEHTGLSLSPQVIEEALRERQFVLHYQPKVSLADGSVTGFEGLLRWQHPLLGLLSPERFIGDLERNGTIALVTARVIDLGIEWLAGSGLDESMNLAINLSAVDLGTPDLADRIHRRCVDLAIDPARIVFELTETSAMKFPDTALATLTRMRIKGFGVAIDDFGTGYSSMVQLARLPFSSMKVDRSFVMSMETSAESRKIVGSIISLGQSLGLKLVAEGVDTAGAARALRELGCDVAQGYWISPAIDAATVPRWLQAWNPAAFVGALECGVAALRFRL
jgi:EAL domain-containing protein (putative c-di-GMP-specific phosphodiesterase class I)/CheY-like chemotaxis protein